MVLPTNAGGKGKITNPTMLIRGELTNARNPWVEIKLGGTKRGDSLHQHGGWGLGKGLECRFISTTKHLKGGRLKIY